jgi:hypothetical protein
MVWRATGLVAVDRSLLPSAVTAPRPATMTPAAAALSSGDRLATTANVKGGKDQNNQRDM